MYLRSGSARKFAAGARKFAFPLHSPHTGRYRRTYSTHSPNSKSNSNSIGQEIWNTTAAVALGYVSYDLYHTYLAPKWASEEPANISCQRGIDRDTDVALEGLEIWSGDTTGTVAENMLRAEEASYSGEGGIERFDVMRVGSNFPSEDEYCHGFFRSPWNGADIRSANEAAWSAFGVFDGHLGGQVSTILRESLVPFLRKRLEATCSSIPEDQRDLPASSQAIDTSIKTSFIEVDDAILRSGRNALTNSSLPYDQATSRVITGYNGSCALLSLFDPTTRNLRVACVGDSRAVLGRQGSDGKYTAVSLSVDQTGSNADEIARLQKVHPNEPDMIKGGRVLGIVVPRAFGDWLWKWDKETQEDAMKRFFHAKIRDNLKSPPYLTAEPVITTTKIPRGSRDFVIMASDGFWDNMTNEKAVELVQTWREWKDSGAKEPIIPKDIVPQRKTIYEMPDGAAFLKDQNVVVKDKNVATHLARNSLGGGDEELLRALVGVKSPQSREMRDDITVQVIFFDGK